ncbi:hypothetical protein H2200_000024 [Cladophialophora chaetospira]|uniref:Uncharacterized protein n=1 Tax=Cladophialophora chaetospira TaxID=386627 RepID=A0AA38XMZ2_9EURO|nr:hypothetical protein H2200_000024 [Cladophialophora chaetospira]
MSDSESRVDTPVKSEQLDIPVVTDAQAYKLIHELFVLMSPNDSHHDQDVWEQVLADILGQLKGIMLEDDSTRSNQEAELSALYVEDRLRRREQLKIITNLRVVKTRIAGALENYCTTAEVSFKDMVALETEKGWEAEAAARLDKELAQLQDLRRKLLNNERPS